MAALLHGEGMGVIMGAGAGYQSPGVRTGICLFRIVAPELTHHRVIGSVRKI